MKVLVRIVNSEETGLPVRLFVKAVLKLVQSKSVAGSKT